MKKLSDRIIITASTIIFLFIGSYLTVLTYSEIMAGTSARQLLSNGVVMGGLFWISLFSVIFMVNSYNSTRRGYHR